MDKKFWKTIRRNFSIKCKTTNTYILAKNNKILQDNKTIGNTFINYTLFFISNQGQASALKVAYIFKVYEAQICLIVA